MTYKCASPWVNSIYANILLFINVSNQEDIAKTISKYEDLKRILIRKHFDKTGIFLADLLLRCFLADLAVIFHIFLT